jgi:hypothetical protein
MPSSNQPRTVCPAFSRFAPAFQIAPLTLVIVERAKSYEENPRDYRPVSPAMLRQYLIEWGLILVLQTKDGALLCHSNKIFRSSLP